MQPHFDTHHLRRIFNEGTGRGRTGESNRLRKNITITPDTWERFSDVVRTGPGQYGSPVIELGILVILFVFANEDKATLPKLVKMLVQVAKKPGTVSDRLRALADGIDSQIAVNKLKTKSDVATHRG